jgi:hypothetical protein
MLEKLIWICSVMLVGARHGGVPVGVVEKEFHSEVSFFYCHFLEVNLFILSITICLVERKYYNIHMHHAWIEIV